MMIWFHCLFTASIVGFIVWSRRTEWRREVVWGGLMLVALCCLAATVAWPNLLLVQKTITALAMPCGLIWLLLLGMTLLAWQRRRASSSFLLLLFLLFTIAGNNVVASLLFSWLQQPFAEIDPLEAGEFDAIAVLGGGAGSRISGYAQVGDAGDRVVLAARLYHAGHTPTLVAASYEGVRYPSRVAAHGDPTQVIWRQLRIPDEAIVLISEPNTREEIIALRELVEQRKWRRVGLITSAWHLRRTMRLAQVHNLTVEPLPSDFRDSETPWNDFSVIPLGAAMHQLQIGAKEMLGMAVGR